MFRTSRLIGATLPLTLAALMSTPAARAQTAPADAASTGDATATDTEQDGEIVVTGSYARSIAAATEAKRKAAYGLDSIASTDIGKFPAQNVAEALQVVPGVAITRPRGEGLYVSVRSTTSSRTAAQTAASSASKCSPPNSFRASMSSRRRRRT
jgi:iron complex outermembrane receptor protein